MTFFLLVIYYHTVLQIKADDCEKRNIFWGKEVDHRGMLITKLQRYFKVILECRFFRNRYEDISGKGAFGGSIWGRCYSYILCQVEAFSKNKPSLMELAVPNQDYNWTEEKQPTLRHKSVEPTFTLSKWWLIQLAYSHTERRCSSPRFKPPYWI